MGEKMSKETVEVEKTLEQTLESIREKTETLNTITQILLDINSLTAELLGYCRKYAKGQCEKTLRKILDIVQIIDIATATINRIKTNIETALREHDITEILEAMKETRDILVLEKAFNIYTHILKLKQK